MKLYSTAAVSITLFLSACGRPPSGRGGPPQGDFPARVVAAPVKSMDLRDKIVLVGSLVSPEEIAVTARVQAELLELPVRPGQAVEAGILLARLDDVRILARKAEMEARVTLTRNTLERMRRLFGSNTATQQELDEAQGAFDQAAASLTLLEAELRDSRITAPFAGRVGERLVSQGQVLQAGQVLFTLTRMDPLEIRFEVPERFSAALREGMAVRMRSEAYPEERFEGVVVFLSPNVNPQTRSLVVRAEIANPYEKLRPGMFGQVELVLEERPGALVVPEAAVMQQGPANSVLRRNAEGRAELVRVQVGLRFDGQMEIRSGLSEGDVVVVEGLMIKARPGSLLAISPDSERFGLSPEKASAETGDE